MDFTAETPRTQREARRKPSTREGRREEFSRLGWRAEEAETAEGEVRAALGWTSGRLIPLESTNPERMHSRRGSGAEHRGIATKRLAFGSCAWHMVTWMTAVWYI